MNNNKLIYVLTNYLMYMIFVVILFPNTLQILKIDKYGVDDESFFSGRLNKNNEWLSGNIYSSKRNSKSLTYLFNREVNSSFLISKYRNIPGVLSDYSSFNLQWSSDNSNSFYLFHREESNYEFYNGHFNIFPKYGDLNLINQAAPKTEALPYLSLQKEDEYFLVLNNKLTSKTEIITNNSDFNIVDSVIDDKFILQGINAKYVDLNYESIVKAAATFKYPHANTKHIYYVPDLWVEFDENQLITPIIGSVLNPNSKSEKDYPQHSQFSPSFNSRGDLLAFIHEENSTLKEYSLYIYHTPDSKVSPNEYLLVDNSIYTMENKEDTSEPSLIMDYCWHPIEDILFYVTLEFQDKIRSQRIKYFDFESKSSHYLNAGTQNNGNISISQDGNFLVVQTWGFTPGLSHFNNCQYFGKKENNHQCCANGDKDVILSIIKLKII